MMLLVGHLEIGPHNNWGLLFINGRLVLQSKGGTKSWYPPPGVSVSEVVQARRFIQGVRDQIPIALEKIAYQHIQYSTADWLTRHNVAVLPCVIAPTQRRQAKSKKRKLHPNERVTESCLVPSHCGHSLMSRVEVTSCRRQLFVNVDGIEILASSYEAPDRVEQWALKDALRGLQYLQASDSISHTRKRNAVQFLRTVFDVPEPPGRAYILVLRVVDRETEATNAW